MAQTRGEPGAEKLARRVREGAPGNGPVATPAPRPRAYLTAVLMHHLAAEGAAGAAGRAAKAHEHATRLIANEEVPA